MQLPAGQTFYGYPGFFSTKHTKTLNNDGDLYNDGIMFNVVNTDSIKFKDVTVKNNHIHCMMQTQVEVADFMDYNLRGNLLAPITFTATDK